MPLLENYTQFDGRYWETGTVRNYFDYSGVKAPHTGEPYSEALFMGVSGGAVMGYFSFAYKGYDPMARILTRNTFDPFDTMLARLGVVQHRLHTAKPEKGIKNLVETLAEGVPAIVWADLFSLPYNARPEDPNNWGMLPIVVYGYDEAADTVWISDRATVPLTTTTAELQAARARVKKDKFRVLTLEAPNPDKLATAVHLGLSDCVKLYTEKPPKGSKNNFGLQAYRWLAELLTNPKTRMSWEKEFPPGRKMYAGLLSMFQDINTFGKDGYAERDRYADFLREAAVILTRPELAAVADQFQNSAQAWQALSLILLPEEIDPFREARALTLRRKQLFVTQGNTAVPAMKEIDARLEEIAQTMATDFPLAAAGVSTLRESIAEQLLHIHDIEQAAIQQLAELIV